MFEMFGAYPSQLGTCFSSPKLRVKQLEAMHNEALAQFLRQETGERFRVFPAGFWVIAGFLNHQQYHQVQKTKMNYSKWWFQRFFIFTPTLGKSHHFDGHIFQMGGSTTN